MTHEQLRLNAEKSFALATALFPNEKWIQIETNIWAAKSRLIGKKREKEKFKHELAQVRILTRLGRVAYFLPEMAVIGKNKTQSADLVMDGEVVEMKTVSGTRATLGTQFKCGYRQGSLLVENCTLTKKHSVFIWLKNDMSLISVMSKIAGELKERSGQGRFICYFEASGDLYSWTYDKLRSIITKNK